MKILALSTYCALVVCTDATLRRSIQSMMIQATPEDTDVSGSDDGLGGFFKGGICAKESKELITKTCSFGLAATNCAILNRLNVGNLTTCTSPQEFVDSFGDSMAAVVEAMLDQLGWDSALQLEGKNATADVKVAVKAAAEAEMEKGNLPFSPPAENASKYRNLWKVLDALNIAQATSDCFVASTLSKLFDQFGIRVCPSRLKFLSKVIVKSVNDAVDGKKPFDVFETACGMTMDCVCSDSEAKGNSTCKIACNNTESGLLLIKQCGLKPTEDEAYACCNKKSYMPCGWGMYGLPQYMLGKKNTRELVDGANVTKETSVKYCCPRESKEGNACGVDLFKKDKDDMDLTALFAGAKAASAVIADSGRQPNPSSETSE